MPGTTGKLCPICDSPVEPGAKKCSFCGTDLTIFGGESEETAQEETQVVEQTFKEAAAAPKPQTQQAPAAAAPAAPKAEPPKASPPAQEEALFQCPNCNGMVKESDTVCPHCGAMFVEDEGEQFECPNCGVAVDAAATTCPGCGAMFVEEEEGGEEGAKPAPAAEAQKAAPAAAAPAEAQQVGADESIIVVESSETTASDEEIRSKVIEIKEGRGQEAAEPVKKVKKTGIGGIFRGGKPEGEAPAAKEGAAVAPKQVAAAPAMTLAIPPATKRQIPTDPKVQGVELAKQVNEVRTLLTLATEKKLLIDESKDMLDRAIAAGRERQLTNALTLVTNAEEKLNTRLREFAVASFSALMEEMAVATRLGGNTSKAEVLAKEAKRAAETPDYPAAFIFMEKAKAELTPITGKYNSAKSMLHKYERLVKDTRAVGIDNEPLKETLEEAKAAFDKLDFEKAGSIAKGSTEEIMEMVKARIGPEIDKAKSMLVEVKMKADTGTGVGPQITILKSAIKAYKEENYLEALAEIKKFKKEIKRLLSPA